MEKVEVMVQKSWREMSRPALVLYSGEDPRGLDYLRRGTERSGVGKAIHAKDRGAWWQDWRVAIEGAKAYGQPGDPMGIAKVTTR